MAEIRVSLTLIGECYDPDYVTQRLQMTPDILRLPDERLGNGCLFGHTEWGIQTAIVVSDEVEVVLRSLWNRLNCNAHALKSLAEELNAQWHCLCYLRTQDGNLPAICFSSESIRFLAEIGAEMGFDTYNRQTIAGVLRDFFSKYL